MLEPKPVRLEPKRGASVSSKLRTIPAFPRATALALVFLFGLSSAMLGQQAPPAPAPAPAQQQTPAPTSAPPEIAADDPDNGSPVSGYFWLTGGGGAKLLPGAKAAVPLDQILAMPNARPRSPGGSVSIPAGKFNHLEISYFQVDANGTSTALVPLSLFGTNIPQGQFLSTTTRVRDAQLTWNYLTWPAPPEDSKFRLHTLYAFNYTSVSGVVDAPYDPDPSFTAANGTRNIFYPSLGISAEYIPSKYFYMEARTWGFGIPHHAAIGDAEITIVARIKHFEIFGGYKLFHYKTSPGSDQFFVGTVKGPLGGIRWVLR